MSNTRVIHKDLLHDMIKVEMLLKKFCEKENPVFKEKALLLMRKTIEIVAEIPEPSDLVDEI